MFLDINIKPEERVAAIDDSGSSVTYGDICDFASRFAQAIPKRSFIFILAENKIGIFSVSTFNTDYILVKAENFERAMEAVSSSGYEVATVSKSGSDF